MPESEIEKRHALIALLSLPDSPDLRRGHRLTLEGRADRHRILPRLAATFVQQHLVDLDERRSWESSSQPAQGEDGGAAAINDDGFMIGWRRSWLSVLNADAEF